MSFMNIDYGELVFGKMIGSGSEGAVFTAEWKGQRVAVKKVIDIVDKEISLLSRLKHPHIVRLMGVCKRHPDYAVVMELCDRSLCDYLARNKNISHAIWALWAKQIAEGMEYLHNNNVVHRDLKSMNILMSKRETLKICDFGISKKYNHFKTAEMTFCGTYRWMAPELWNKEPCSEKVDVWSYGVVLWEILTQQIPYSKLSDTDMFKTILINRETLSIPIATPNNIRVLMEQCWCWDPRNRPSFTTILERLADISAALGPASTSEKNRFAIGIDLGTTFTCVGVVNDAGKVAILRNEFDNKITPSVVSMTEHCVFVGEDAVCVQAEYPKNTIYEAKRFMGKRADEIKIRYPFQVQEGQGGMAQFVVYPGDKRTAYCPEQVSAYLLSYMKDLAEKYLEMGVTEAVITVPANFNNAQRQATKDAGRIAGLNVLRVVNEPTAAAIAHGYGYGRNDGKKRKILVYDLGGGTFDVSIIQMKGMDAQVLATSGIVELGGTNFDRRIRDTAIAMFMSMNVSVTGKELKLLEACEHAKRILSTEKSALIEMRGSDGRTKGFEYTREMLNHDCEDLFQMTKRCVEQAMNTAGISASELDDIVLVGGCTQIPRVREILQDHFKGRKLRTDINPDEAVAYGAAIIAHSLNSPEGEERIKLEDVNPLSIGVVVNDHSLEVVIPANKPYPTSVTHSYKKDGLFQKKLRILVYEGESKSSFDNHFLGSLVLPFRFLRQDMVDVTFAINVNGILKISAVVRETGAREQLTIETGRAGTSAMRKMAFEAEESKKREKEERKRRTALAEHCFELSRLRRAARLISGEVDRKRLKEYLRVEEHWFNNNKETCSEATLRARTKAVIIIVEQYRLELLRLQ